MAIIKPFKALRYNTDEAGNIELLTCPPYDVINKQDYNKFLNKSEFNIIRLEKPVGDDPYTNAKKLLDEWKSNNIFKKDKCDSIYIYEQEFKIHNKTKKLKGFICDVLLEEFSKGNILPHEHTLSKAKEDRFDLMKSTFCNFSQVYSLYMDSDKKITDSIEKLSKNKPQIEFKDDDSIIHRLWIVDNSLEISKIQKEFESKKLFIADGHHRYETALKFRDYHRKNGMSKPREKVDYIMMMLVNIENEGLVVLPTHRVVKNLKNFDPNDLINKCSEYFYVEEKNGINNIEVELKTLYDKYEKAFALYLKGDSWFLLRLKNIESVKESLLVTEDAVKNLDVTILHFLVLEKLLNIDSVSLKNQMNLEYTRSVEQAIKSVKDKEAVCAFFMNPSRISEIKSVACNLQKMPQKSTFFYPKLITGLVINELK